MRGHVVAIARALEGSAVAVAAAVASRRRIVDACQAGPRNADAPSFAHDVRMLCPSMGGCGTELSLRECAIARRLPPSRGAAVMRQTWTQGGGSSIVQAREGESASALV